MSALSLPLSSRNDFPLVRSYTGTLDNPDTVSVFFKSRSNIEFRDEALFNSMSYSPTNYFRNIPIVLSKIDEACKRIFKNMKGERGDLWNACKNLGRGMIQLIPLVGNATLYLYDQVKMKFYTHPQIKTELSNKNEAVFGLAFDGKIINTFSRIELESFIHEGDTTQSDNPLDLLYYYWLIMLEDNLKNDTGRTKLQLATVLANDIHHGV